jgi:uncharacterized protein YjbJ (UPF0337 family)
MKPTTRDKLAGRIHEAKGKSKQKLEERTKSPNLKMEGAPEKAANQDQSKAGEIENLFER